LGEEEKVKVPLKTRLKRLLGFDSPPRMWELQIFYGKRGSGRPYGWHTIWTTDDHEPKPSEVADQFEPGQRYRLIRRNLETGRYDKICWKHFEPKGPELLEGATEKIEEKTTRPPPRQLTPTEVMGAWAMQVKEVLEPLKYLGEIRRDILEAFGANEGGGGNSSSEAIPPLRFSGEAPWVMHPYVVKYVGDTVKEIIGYGFDRAEKFAQKVGISPEAGLEAETEIEEITLPRPSEFFQPETPLEPTTAAVQPTALKEPEPIEEVKPPPETPKKARRKKRKKKEEIKIGSQQ